MPKNSKPLGQFCNHLLSIVEQNFLCLTQPAHHSLALSTASHLLRNKSQLVAENALLRQQLIILHRQVKKPRFSSSDRLWLVLPASRVKNWKEALLLFKPDTLLRWHRQGFRLFWKFKSRNRGGRPRLDTETIALIQQMAQENRLWGAERIRGELLKLGLIVAKHTIQKYIVRTRPATPASSTWAIFLKNHAKDIWACDFLPVLDPWFRPLYLFFIVEVASGRIVHFGVARWPTVAWVFQQLRGDAVLQAPKDTGEGEGKKKKPPSYLTGGYTGATGVGSQRQVFPRDFGRCPTAGTGAAHHPTYLHITDYQTSRQKASGNAC